MSKINILAIGTGNSGVFYYRTLKPHITLQRDYSEEVFIDIVNEGFDGNIIKNYDIIHVHLTSILSNYKPIIDLIKKENKKLIVDIDDYWVLGTDHNMNHVFSKPQIRKDIIDMIKMADHITIATDKFAEKIRKINPNVTVLENGIDFTDSQYEIKDKVSSKIRFGWLGGVNHINDLSLLSNGINTLLEDDNINKINIALCGFTDNSYKEYIKDGVKRKVKNDYKDNTWYKYEKIMTANFRGLSDFHKNSLSLMNESIDMSSEYSYYKRFWSKDVKIYASNFNNLDVVLAPLKETEYNIYKSELKAIEAGVFKKLFIGSDLCTYNNLIIDYRKDPINGNGFLVEPSKNNKDWGKVFKLILEKPELINILGERLHEKVKNKYNITEINKKRISLYKNINNG